LCIFINSPRYNENNDRSEVRKMSKIIFNEIQIKQLEKNESVLTDNFLYICKNHLQIYRKFGIFFKKEMLKYIFLFLSTKITYRTNTFGKSGKEIVWTSGWLPDFA